MRSRASASASTRNNTGNARGSRPDSDAGDNPWHFLRIRQRRRVADRRDDVKDRAACMCSTVPIVDEIWMIDIRQNPVRVAGRKTVILSCSGSPGLEPLAAVTTISGRLPRVVSAQQPLRVIGTC